MGIKLLMQGSNLLSQYRARIRIFLRINFGSALRLSSKIKLRSEYLKKSIKKYFDQLNDRERIISLLGIFFLVCFLFYFVIYSPLASSVRQKQNLLQDKKDTYAWMTEVSNNHMNVKLPEILTSAQSLSVISSELKKSNLQKFAYQLEQTTFGDIQLNFEKVPYNDFVTWLWKFSGKYGLSIKEFSATNKNSDGLIAVKLVLSSSK